MMTAEINALEMDLTTTTADLRAFEQQYQLSTADFFHQWQAGQTNDRLDYVEWAALAQMADNLRQRVQLLKGESQL